MSTYNTLNKTMNSFLVRNFQEFYHEILRSKEMALRHAINSLDFPQMKPPGDLGAAGATSAQGPHSKQKNANQTDNPATLGNIPGAPGNIPGIPGATAATTPIPGPIMDVGKGAGKASQEHAVHEHLTDRIQQRLRFVLERQGLGVQNQVGEFAISQFQEAQYLMVALADEIFLNISWNESKRWENRLMESQLYQTQIAGELIFKKIDTLLDADDPLRMDLCRIYLMALGLGFRGKYRHENDDTILDGYRQKLYHLINRQPVNLFSPYQPQLMSDCYDHLLDSVMVKGLPDVRVWGIAFSGVILTYLLISSFIWYTLARDIDSSIEYIMKQAQLMGLS